MKTNLTAWFACALAMSLAVGCDDGGKVGGPEPTASMYGIWVSTDDPGTTVVLEVLPYEPYHPALAGASPVYRVWELVEGQSPEWTQLGRCVVRAGGFETTVVRSRYSNEVGQDYRNEIHELDEVAGRLVLESPGRPDDRRTYARQASFPGGAWPGGEPAPVGNDEPILRRMLEDLPGFRDDVYRGTLFRTGVSTALAVRAITFFPGAVTETTTLSMYETDDRGGAWTRDMTSGIGNYASSEARFKEQTHGRPLVYPNDTLSEYLYLWSPELGVWERDNDVQICRESVGFPDQDIVLTAFNGLAYSLCVVDPQVVYVHRRRPDLNSRRIQNLVGPVVAVRGQWVPGEGLRGALYSLVHTGVASPVFRLYRHEETDLADFLPEDFAAPVAELEVACGGLPCEVVEVRRYHVAGGVHHIVATARFDGPAPRHPLAPENRLALHLHGSPETGFTTEVLNMADGADGPVFLGNLVDVDLPVDGIAGDDGWAAVLQDYACLRVLRGGQGAPWTSVGVVPTIQRPAPDATLVWGDQLGLLSANQAMDYLLFGISTEASRCPPPRAMP